MFAKIFEIFSIEFSVTKKFRKFFKTTNPKFPQFKISKLKLLKQKLNFEKYECHFTPIKYFHRLDFSEQTKKKHLFLFPSSSLYFRGDALLTAVMRFLTDPTQTPNSRVKVSTLAFLTHVAESCEPSALNVTCKSALARLLDWTNDVKSQDVRRHAQDAVISLYNLNPPQFPMILSELPKFYQDAAMPLIQNHLRRSSTASNPASPGAHSGRMPQSPARTITTKTDVDMTDADNLNPEEVSKYIRRTTAEIQNYEFERAATSKDSGISNMADVEEKLESLTLTNSGRSSSVSSPTQRGKTSINSGVNGSGDTTIAGDLILPQENNGYGTHSSSPDLLRGSEVLDKTIATLQSTNIPNRKKGWALEELKVYVRDGNNAVYIKQHFK